MNIAEVLSAILEDGCNRLLRLDGDTLRSLGDLDEKVFCLRINKEGKGEIGPNLYFFPSEGGFRIRHEYEGEPDVTITGNPPAILRMMVGESTPDFIGTGQMQITGDLELGQRFQKILKKIDIDWEEHLSKFVGDVAAHRTGVAARQFRGWGKHVAETLKQDFSEVMTEELRITPVPETVQKFMGSVDQIKVDVDRLEKRFSKLKDNKSGDDRLKDAGH